MDDIDMNNDEDIVSQEFFDQLDEINPKTIIIPISGGVDSVVCALSMYEKGYDCILMFNDTHRAMKTAINSINKVIKFTGFPLIVTHPELSQREIVKETKDKIIKLMPAYMSRERKINKKDIPCCKYLKEKPAKDFYKKYIDVSNTVIISGIAPYEGNQRDAWSRQIRNRNTYFHPHSTKNGLIFGYPLRDLFDRQESPILLSDYLMSKGFGDTRHSGCAGSCPIVGLHYVVNKKRIEPEQKRLDQSVRFWIPEKYISSK